MLIFEFPFLFLQLLLQILSTYMHLCLSKPFVTMITRVFRPCRVRPALRVGDFTFGTFDYVAFSCYVI
jgi:hypothetical protein